MKWTIPNILRKLGVFLHLVDLNGVKARDIHPLLKVTSASECYGLQLHVHEHTDADFEALRELRPKWLRCDFAMEAFFAARISEGHVKFFDIPDAFVQLASTISARLIFTTGYKDAAGQSCFLSGTYVWHVVDAVKRYAGLPVIWELLNEPDNKAFGNLDPVDYMNFSRRLIGQMREANPQVCIVGPACSGINKPFLEGCFNNHALDLWDGITLHPYRPGKPPETLPADLDHVRQMMRDAGGPVLPILVGEMGYPESPQTTQATYLPRLMKLCGKQRVPCVWYQFRSDPGDNSSGLMTFGFQKDPTYDAFLKLKGD